MKLKEYQTYSEYKESGEEWLGDIPSHWEAIQIKHLSPVKRGASPRPIDDPKYFDDEGDYAWTRIADVTASDRYLYEAPQKLSDLGSSLSVKLEPNSLFLSIAGSVGKPCITGIKACIHDGFVYFPELKLPPKFLFYVFAGEQAYKGLGKFGTQLNLNTDTVGAIKVGIGSPEEIENIVNFLDHETAKIDTLIEKQQQLIKLLKEKRQAVISHAVTKGLNPDVPTKDSGVEWLGEVPEHWTIKPLKFACKFQRGHDLPADKRNEGNIPVVTSAGISAKHDTARANAPGLVTGRYGTIGDFTLVEEDYWPLNTTLYSVDLYENEVKFLWYLLHNLKPIFIVNSLKSAVPGVDRNDLHPTPIAMPESKEEQAKIVNYLDELLNKYRKAEDKAVEQISLLKERRTALISAAVTGKIDVRNWQPENQSAQANAS